MQLDKFKGPLDKLLELIEERKMPISEISIAAVTDEFLKYIEKLKEIDFEMLADFISVASKLILIKSKSLLPSLELTSEEESDIQDLQKRLVLYQELKLAKRHIQELWIGDNHGFSRPYLLSSSVFPVFAPGKSLQIPVLKSAMEKLLEVVQKFTYETETIKEKIISLEDKISEIIGRIAKIGETTFKKMGSFSKSEMIITFLAILHLARDQMVRLEQAEHFSDIIITKTNP